jgi:hypothetical protein
MSNKKEIVIPEWKILKLMGLLFRVGYQGSLARRDLFDPLGRSVKLNDDLVLEFIDALELFDVHMKEAGVSEINWKPRATLDEMAKDLSFVKSYIEINLSELFRLFPEDHTLKQIDEGTIYGSSKKATSELVRDGLLKDLEKKVLHG